jgi:hypothetical protein
LVEFDFVVFSMAHKVDMSLCCLTFVSTGQHQSGTWLAMTT